MRKCRYHQTCCFKEIDILYSIVMPKILGHKIICVVVTFLIAMFVPFVAMGQTDGDIQSAEYFFRNGLRFRESALR